MMDGKLETYSWGCEYLDLESFKEPEPIPVVGVWLPMHIVEAAVDKDYISSDRFSINSNTPS